MVDNLPAIDLGAGILTLAITAHHHHICALVNGSRIQC
jgi:hypothetical protein